MTSRHTAFSVVLVVWIATSGHPLVAQVGQDFLAANIGTSISPRDDFFQYAKGAWLKRNPIPEDQGRWGIWNVPSEDLNSLLRRAGTRVVFGT